MNASYQASLVTRHIRRFTGFITAWNLGILSTERHQQRRVLDSAPCTHNAPPDVPTPVLTGHSSLLFNRISGILLGVWSSYILILLTKQNVTQLTALKC